MTDRNVNVEAEMQEIHEDVSVIAQKNPKMVPILVGVIKGLRLSTEAGGDTNPPKVTA